MEARSDRLSVTVVGSTLERTAIVSALWIVLLLLAGFTLTWLLGGASSYPPHWFYVPIMFAGIRFGLAGAVPVAIAAGILVGPLTPADVATGAAQPLSDWATRGVFFVAVGATLPAMVRLGTSTIQGDRRRLRVEAEVRRGLDHGEFVLHYQPIVQLESGDVVGAEALLRWRHPERGLLMPDQFIDTIERIGSVASWVISEAAATAARWRRDHGLDQFTVSVNISAQNLAQPDFVTQVRTALRAAQLEARHLCLELTERSLVEDLAGTGARLQILRSIGVRIAIDDFGTGHSNLTYLRELPIDVIKVDRSFVNDVGHPRADSIIASIPTLARELGATCVAEGIETDAQRQAIRAQGIRYAQGYLFARPLDAATFEERLLAGAVSREPLSRP